MKVNSIHNFNPNYTHKFFFDTNIWLYLFFPQHSQVAQKIIDTYTVFFDKVVSKQCLVITDMVQMSELVNLILRLEHKQYVKINGEISFKEYRNSSSFSNALLNVKILTTSIIKNATLRSGIFNESELKAMVEQCDKADLNDIYFAELSAKEKAIFITNDSDFKALRTDLNIYSANLKLLN